LDHSALAVQCWALKHKFSHYNLKKSDPIVIIFGTNTSDITGHQNLTQLLLFCWKKSIRRNNRWN